METDKHNIMWKAESQSWAFGAEREINTNLSWWEADEESLGRSWALQHKQKLGTWAAKHHRQRGRYKETCIWEPYAVGFGQSTECEAGEQIAEGGWNQLIWGLSGEQGRIWSQGDRNRGSQPYISDKRSRARQMEDVNRTAWVQLGVTSGDSGERWVWTRIVNLDMERRAVETRWQDTH